MTMPVYRKNTLDSGVTLIELLTVLAIIAILSGIAYPSYLESLRKGRRVDATSSLLRIQLAQLRYRSQHIHYAEHLPDLGWAEPGASDRGYFRITLDTGINPEIGFRAMAMPVHGSDQDKDLCRLFVIDASGPNRDDSSAALCWD